ncbi:MAG: hypothetical protein GTO24_04155 [candidate division Zixibacteria bacterium]|nr:hypothetical protein [candidate division Zixibacteria bacterium]
MFYWFGFGLILIIGVGFLIVLLYAIWVRWSDPQDKTRSRLQNLVLALFDPEAWAMHRHDLLAIAEYAKNENIQLIVVIIPHLIFTEQSAPIVKRVSEVFQAEGVPTLDITELIQGEPRSTILAGRVDPHASELVHQRIAERLYHMIRP